METLRRVVGRLFVIMVLIGAPLEAHALGILVPRIPEATPIQLGRAEVNVDIKQNIAKTRILQEFYNPNPRQLEADFYFPVPKGANVTDFVLYMDGKPVKGEVLEREKAREIYEGIVRRLKDPGLVEWVDYNLFKVRVFPVPATGTQKIEIEFAQALEADQGQFKYMLPLKTPRGVVAENRPAPDVKFEMSIESDEPVRNVYSPSHQVDTDMKDPRKVHVSVPAKSFAPALGNFLLFYELSNKDIALSLLARKVGSGDGFFSLMLSPPTKEATTAPATAADYVFVIDTSGSMMDDNKIGQARKALRYCVGQLRPIDRFNVLRFSTEVEKWGNGLSAGSPENIDSARNWIDQLQARGGTNISGALDEALKLGVAQTSTSVEFDGSPDPSPGKGSRVCTVVFITDGLPTVGITDPERIVKEIAPNPEQRGSTRIFTFGVGHDVNTKLLDRLAENTRAASDYIRPAEDMEVPIGRFFDKISRPAMTNLKLDLPSADVYDVYPKELPDLFYGTQLTIFGRYKKAGSTAIRLTGQVAGKPADFTYEKTLPGDAAGNEFVEKLWGTRKIAYLLDQIRKSGESREVKDEVVTLAKKYGVVTPYTSYLVQEDTVAPPPMPRVAQVPATTPVAVPDQSWFGRRHAGNAPAAPGSSTAADWVAPSGGAVAAKASRSAGTESLRRTESLSASSGQMAVDAAKDLRKMKEISSTTADEESGTRRSVAGKTFTLSGGMWVDSELQGNEANVLKIKYLSDAYFEALRVNPELKDVFALGTQVRIKLSNVVLEVGPEGLDKLSPEQVSQLEKKK